VQFCVNPCHHKNASFFDLREVGAKLNAKIETIIIYTSKMKEMLKFYSDALGIGPFFKYSDDGHMGCNVRGVYLGFDKVKDDDEGRKTVTLWFTVDDLKETFDRCISLGATVRTLPGLKPWGDKIGSVFDLDGNVLGLVQRWGGDREEAATEDMLEDEYSES
jgi:uncharacterized glyoxalase superfamily protein PhnB